MEQMQRSSGTTMKEFFKQKMGNSANVRTVRMYAPCKVNMIIIIVVRKLLIIIVIILLMVIVLLMVIILLMVIMM